MSKAAAGRRHSLAEASASTPVPAPMSSTRRGRKRRARKSSAKRQPWVEPCSPVPKAVAAPIFSATDPAGTGPLKCEPKMKNRPALMGGKLAWLAVSQSCCSTRAKASCGGDPASPLQASVQPGLDQPPVGRAEAERVDAPRAARRGFEGADRAAQIVERGDHGLGRIGIGRLRGDPPKVCRLLRHIFLLPLRGGGGGRHAFSTKLSITILSPALSKAIDSLPPSAARTTP